MADIASDHLFLGQCLPPVHLSQVVVISVRFGPAAVVPELCRRHRGPFQVPTEIFDAAPGFPGLFGEVGLPAASVLGLKVTLPLFFVADRPLPRQAVGIKQVKAVAQQADDGSAPDIVFNIESATGDGQVNVWGLVKLVTVSVQGA